MESKIAWVIDDDPIYQRFVEDFLTTVKYTVRKFSRGEDSLDCLHEMPDLIVLDHNLGEGLNGLETLRRIKGVNPEIPVVYLSAQEELSSAVEALKYGSFDYIEKNSATLPRLQNTIEKIKSIDILLEKRHTSRVRILILSIITCFIILMSMIYFFMTT